MMYKGGLVVTGIVVGFMVLGCVSCGQHEKQQKIPDEQAAQAKAETEARQRVETQPQPESSPPIERPPDVIGYPRPQDGAAFTGVFVLNECGTTARPPIALPNCCHSIPILDRRAFIRLHSRLKGSHHTGVCVLSRLIT